MVVWVRGSLTNRYPGHGAPTQLPCSLSPSAGMYWRKQWSGYKAGPVLINIADYLHLGSLFCVKIMVCGIHSFCSCCHPAFPSTGSQSSVGGIQKVCPRDPWSTLLIHSKCIYIFFLIAFLY